MSGAESSGRDRRIRRMVVRAAGALVLSAAATALATPAHAATAYRIKPYRPGDCTDAQAGCVVIETGDPSEPQRFRKVARLEPWLGIATLGISPDGRRLIAVRSFFTDSTVYAIDARTGSIERRISIPLGTVFSAIRPGTSEVWAGGTGASGLAIEVIDAATGATDHIQTTLPAGRTPVIAFDRTGSRALLADGPSIPPGPEAAPRSIVTVDAARRTVEREVTLPLPEGLPNFVPDTLAAQGTTRVLVAGHAIRTSPQNPFGVAESTLALVDPVAKAVVGAVPLTTAQFAAAVEPMPDGRFAASLVENGTKGSLVLLDGTTGAQDGAPIPLPRTVEALSFSPDGRFAYGSFTPPADCEAFVCTCDAQPIVIDLRAREVVPCRATESRRRAPNRIPRRPAAAAPARGSAYVFKPGPGIAFVRPPRAAGRRTVAVEVSVTAPAAVTATLAQGQTRLATRAATLVRRRSQTLTLRLTGARGRTAEPGSRVLVSVAARDGFGNRERLAATVRLPRR